MVSAKTLGTIALVGLVAIGGYYAYVKASEFGKGLSDIFSGIGGALSFPSNIAGGFVSGLEGVGSNLAQGVSALPPANITKVTPSNLPPTTIATVLNPAIYVKSGVSTPSTPSPSPGNYYGPTIYGTTSAGAKVTITPTVSSAKSQAVSFLMGQTPQATVAYALGVPTSVINPAVNQVSAQRQAGVKFLLGK